MTSYDESIYKTRDTKNYWVPIDSEPDFFRKQARLRMGMTREMERERERGIETGRERERQGERGRERERSSTGCHVKKLEVVMEHDA